MKVVSFFAGAGGFDLGFINAGFDIAVAYEWDKFAVQSYKANLGDHVIQQDVSILKGSDIPEASVWLFGFPCQDVSVAGRKAGMEQGTRTGLFYEIMRLLGEKENKPEIILAENVKGLKKWLPVVQGEYEDAGYRFYMTEYNSKYFGVPQSRERYFLLGVREDLVGDFEFPEQQTNFIPQLKDFLLPNPDPKYYMSETAMLWLQRHRDKHESKGTGFKWDIRPAEGVASTLRANASFAPTDNSVLQAVDEKFFYQDEKVMNVLKDATERMLAKGTQPQLNVLGMAEGINGHDILKRVYDIEGISPTLSTSGGGNQQAKVVVGQLGRYRVRRLTPREYARLQAFPDSYKQVVSDSQFYKQMGNAVTVNVSWVIAEQIKKFLNRGL